MSDGTRTKCGCGKFFAIHADGTEDPCNQCGCTPEGVREKSRMLVTEARLHTLEADLAASKDLLQSEQMVCKDYQDRMLKAEAALAEVKSIALAESNQCLQESERADRAEAALDSVQKAFEMAKVAELNMAEERDSLKAALTERDRELSALRGEMEMMRVGLWKIATGNMGWWGCMTTAKNSLLRPEPKPEVKP